MGKALRFPALSTRGDGAVGQLQLKSSKPKHRSGKRMTELHRAVISADHRRLAELLQQYSSPPVISGQDVSLDINDKDELGRTALHWAVALKDFKSFTTLLNDPRTNCQLTDKDGRTPLHDTAIRGWDEGIAMLLNYEVNDTTSELTGMWIKDNGGRTALHWAVEYRHYRIVKELTKKEFTKQIAWKATDNDGNTALHKAAQRGRKEAVEILLGILPRHEQPENKAGKTPFYVAAENGQEEISWLCFKEHKFQSQHESVALVLIRKCRHLDRTKELFLWAIKKGYTEVVRALLERGADFEDGNFLQQRFWEAAENGFEAIVKLLLDKEAWVNVNAPGGLYGNALQGASSEGHITVVQMLLDKGTDINAQGGYYGNALQAASYGGYDKVVQMLLDKGADVNAQGGLCGNALHAALYGGHDKVVQMLVNNGADVNAKERYSKALQAALSRIHPKEGREKIGAAT